MKTIILIIACIIALVCEVNAQNPSIYFLADTINTPKNERVLKIGMDNAFEYTFTFFCRCIEPYKSYLSFSYVYVKNKPSGEIVSKKPDYPYLSFKEFMDIASFRQNYLNDIYDIYITEVLPNKKYRTNKVTYRIVDTLVNRKETLKKN